MEILFNNLKQWPLPILIFVVGFIWGVTNPLLSATSKPTTTNTEQDQQHNFLSRCLTWLPFLIVFGINQLGSLLNIVLLGIGDLATISPFTNTIGFFVTAIVDMMFFSKRKLTPQFLCGLLFIAFGTWLAIN